MTTEKTTLWIDGHKDDAITVDRVVTDIEEACEILEIDIALAEQVNFKWKYMTV